MKVLIADADRNSVRLLDLILKQEGFQTIICETGSEALRRWQSNEFPPIVIMDLVLPDMSGLDLCKKFRESAQGKATYLMFLTAKGLKENIIAGINAGADDYMVKPFNAEELKARIRAGKRLIQLQRQLLDRNTLLEEFVYTVTHDMRTPLIALDMTTQQAKDGMYGELPESYKKILDTTGRSIKDLLYMVDNLLSVARYESGKIDRTKDRASLVLVCKECLSELNPIYSRKKISCKVACNVQEVELTINRQDLKRVILNLLDNAIKFTPAGGSIDLTVELFNDKVIVGVQDTGRGIAREEAKKVFDRFARAKGERHTPGTGLGLYLCRRIVEAHGGAVDCIPRQQGGTTFSFLLPVASAR